MVSKTDEKISDLLIQDDYSHVFCLANCLISN